LLGVENPGYVSHVRQFVDRPDTQMGSLLGMTSGVPVGECLLNEQPLQ